MKIPLAEEHAHCHKRQVQIRGALQVIAGQHAQAAGVNLNGFMQAEFHAEIRNQRLAVRMVRFPPRVRAVHVRIKFREGAVQFGHKILVARHPLEVALRAFLQDTHRVVVGYRPDARVQFRKQGLNFWSPRPVQVVRQVFQPPDAVWQNGLNGDGLNGLQGQPPQCGLTNAVRRVYARCGLTRVLCDGVSVAANGASIPRFSSANIKNCVLNGVVIKSG